MDAGSLNVDMINNLGKEIVAIGALGTAAFGLVDSFKALPGGGISKCGFKHIRQAIEKLTPSVDKLKGTELSRENILNTLQSQWINGVDKSNQISIAKSLIKLRLIPETARDLATATGVDPDALQQIAEKIQKGISAAPAPQGSVPAQQDENLLSTRELDIYGRFDLLLNTLLDQAYQHADQRYRNIARASAIPVAVVLAIIGASLVFGITWNNFCDNSNLGKLGIAVLTGLISTPIAPIAKDISSAITTAAQAIQLGKK
ncbi:MAG TPA: hypothetical protein VGK21_18845 [Candidatus Angelobacter sp.]